VDAWWGIEEDATLLESAVVSVAQRPPGLYAKPTPHWERWAYLVAVFDAAFVTREGFEEAMCRSRTRDSRTIHGSNSETATRGLQCRAVQPLRNVMRATSIAYRRYFRAYRAFHRWLPWMWFCGCALCLPVAMLLLGKSWIAIVCAFSVYPAIVGWLFFNGFSILVKTLPRLRNREVRG
jgi:hypothetical protein